MRMKTIEEQLSKYKCVHFNKKNIQTHFIGIPLIIWAVTVLMSLNNFQTTIADTVLTFTPAMILFAVSLLYYFKLHIRLALGMVAYIAINLYLASLVSTMENAMWIAIAAFVVGWIIQFIGHHYEKAKPAFVDDLSGLIIGPLFLMAEIYFALGFEKKLNEKITPMAVEKRRQIERAKKLA
jgi:uncharacterized membrane protein YGL010W